MKFSQLNLAMVLKGKMTIEGFKGIESLKGLKGSGCFGRKTGFGELDKSGTQSTKL